MKKRNYIIILVLLLVIGFASVTTNLVINGTLNLAMNEDDLNIYFSNAKENGTKKLSLIKDKKTIEFDANLSEVGDSYTLDYEVTNGSFQYDVALSIKVDSEGEDYITVNNTFNTDKLLEAQNKREGKLRVELKKAVIEDTTFKVTITINAEAKGRTTLGEVVYSEVDEEESYVENNIPYFFVNVSNTADNKLVSPGSKYTVKVENQEGYTNGMFYFVDSFGNASSEEKEYKESITSSEYTFANEKDENTFKVYVKTGEENNRKVRYIVTISSPLNESIITGEVSIPADNFCLENGYNTLSDCMIASDSMTTKENAIKTIKGRKADFTKIEPEVVYTKVEAENVGLSGTMNTAVYFTEEVPKLNSSTGFYSWSSSKAKLGYIKDYISTDSKKYYTYLNTTDTGMCTTVYILREIDPVTNRLIRGDTLKTRLGETASNNPGLYATTDEDGESYYYRGAVQNNYVSYANKIWRIVRRNGDGSVRMIYSGTSPTATGTEAEITQSAYHVDKTDPTFGGYKYGLNQELKTTTGSYTYTEIVENRTYWFADDYNYENGICSLTGNKISGKWKDKYSDVVGKKKYTCWGTSQTGTCTILSEVIASVSATIGINPTQARVKYHGYLSKTYEDTYKDDHDSTIKGIIDSWYVSNISNSRDENSNLYSDYLADNTFCNDRSISITSNNQTGVTLDGSTSYGAAYRVNDNRNPSLICPREEDKFTVRNKKLNYPIALLTADETVMAGGVKNALNSLYYLSSNHLYWTMSPTGYTVSNFSQNVWTVYQNGSLSSGPISGIRGVRPVINLKSNVKIVSGNGTAENPYQVSL